MHLAKVQCTSHHSVITKGLQGITIEIRLTCMAFLIPSYNLSVIHLFHAGHKHVYVIKYGYETGHAE